jgi:hypothetical protein
VYTHEGKANRFKLVVSLHEKSGRTFVHASEETNPNNIQVSVLVDAEHHGALGAPL